MIYNALIKRHLGNTQITFYNKPIRAKEEVKKAVIVPSTFIRTNSNTERTEEQIKHCQQQSLSVTKRKIYDYARAIAWDYFVTFTFDRTKIDSSDYDLVTKKTTQFLNRIRKKFCEDMVYLVVPELHKDGLHYHLHALFKNVDGLNFEHSGKVCCPGEISARGYCDVNKYPEGNPIYNITNWRWGFSTATKVVSYEKVSHYITKYISKDLIIHTANKKRYWHSRNIRLEQEKCNIDLDQLLFTQEISYMKSINIPVASQQISYIELEGHIENMQDLVYTVENEE